MPRPPAKRSRVNRRLGFAGGIAAARSRSTYRTSIPRSIGTTGVGRTWPGKKDSAYNYMFDPMPGKLQVVMRYSTTVNLSNTLAGTTENYLFRTNSIFDPDFTGIGHQPLGHDQWAAFYNRYKVVRSNITCSLLKNSESLGGLIGLETSSTSAFGTGF